MTVRGGRSFASRSCHLLSRRQCTLVVILTRDSRAERRCLVEWEIGRRESGEDLNRILWYFKCSVSTEADALPCSGDEAYEHLRDSLHCSTFHRSHRR